MKAFVRDLMERKHVEGALRDGSAGFNRILVCDVSRQGRFQKIRMAPLTAEAHHGKTPVGSHTGSGVVL